MASNDNLHERLSMLENEVRSLKANKSNENSESKKEKKEKKEKKPREPTEYNKFMSAYINEQKDKLGADFNHKVIFKEAAKKWGEQKEAKTSK